MGNRTPKKGCHHLAAHQVVEASRVPLEAMPGRNTSFILGPRQNGSQQLTKPLHCLPRLNSKPSTGIGRPTCCTEAAGLSIGGMAVSSVRGHEPATPFRLRCVCGVRDSTNTAC